MRHKEMRYGKATDPQGLMRELFISLKRIFFALSLSLAVAAVPAAVLHADSNPANDSAGVEISFVPYPDRGILITTDTPSMLDLGSVEMGVATQTVRPATVTLLGTITNTELELSANITGGWRFDDNVAGQEEDNLQVWTVFKSTLNADVPAKSGSNFDDTNDVLSPASASPYFGPVRVGLANGDGGTNDRFEDGSTNMDSLIPGMKRHWWFYFRTPPATTTVQDQKVTFVLSVTAGP